MASTSDLQGALEAIEAYLDANWMTTPIVKDGEDPPQPWPPVDESGRLRPWVFIEIMDISADIVAFGTPGNQTVRDDGSAKLHVMVPKGEGLSRARQYSVAIGEIFRQKLFYNSDPTAYVRTGTPRIGRGEAVDDEGNWQSLTVTVPYEFYHRR